jgi:pilus assembly protein FimV
LDASSIPVMPEAIGETELASLDFDLGVESHEPTTVVAPALPSEPVVKNFVPDVATTLADGDGVEFDVSLTESTFLGRSMPESNSFDMYSIDLDLNQPELPIPEPASTPAPEKTPAPVVEDSVASENEAFDSALVSTAVNPDFGTAQAETVVNPQFGAELDMLPEFDISENEEVATKLDLAKAYEEMGDLEGARELLNEVLKEGDATQKEKAQAILGKIGA